MFLSRNEWLQLLLSCLVAAFIVSFRKWGDKVFDPVVGITNLILGFIFLVIVIAIKLYFQKKYANGRQYSFKFAPSYTGTFMGVLIAILTYGYIAFFLPGSFSIDQKNRQMVGKYWPINYTKDLGYTSLIGLFTTAVIALFFKALYLITNELIFRYALFIAILVTAFSVIPITNNDGLHLFYSSRRLFVFIFLLAVFFSIGLWISPWYFAILLGVILGLLGLLLYNNYLIEL